MSNDMLNKLAQGRIIREPVGHENGYWAGAPGAYYDPTEKAWYLTYRVRRPRGIHPDRGGEARIARSTDLINFTDVWAVMKDKYNTASIERSAIRRGKDGKWRYYTSYVDATDGRWCVAMLSGDTVAALDPAKVQRIFTAKDLGLEGIKDPWVMEQSGTYYMFLSIALPSSKTNQNSHKTLDIYNTGDCTSATGLATSTDLDHWKWEGVVFKPETAGWDCYCRRINSVLAHKGKYAAFYDGSASHLDNYEEKTGVCTAGDLKSWKTETSQGPLWTSPHTTKSLRYIDAQTVNGETHLFYEFARADGAHDLRLISLKPEALSF